MLNISALMYRTDIPDERVVRKAQKRIKAKKGFFAHLVSYVSVIGFLFMINMLTSPGYWWWLFPAGGWGIGLASHYFTVFGMFGIGSSEWEERELAREIDRLEYEEEGQLLLPEDLDDNLPEAHLELKEREVVRKSWNNRDLV